MKKLYALLISGFIALPLFTNFANAEGIKTVTVDKTRIMGTFEEQRAPLIEIKENDVNGFTKDITFELKLPNNASWSNKTVVSGDRKVKFNKNVMTITCKNTNLDEKEAIYIIPYVNVDEKIKKGDLNIKIRTDNPKDREEVVKIGEIKDYSAFLEGSENKINNNTQGEKVYVILSEAVSNSLTDGVYDLVIDNADVVTGSVKVETLSGKDKVAVKENRDNFITFDFSENGKEKSKFKFTFEIVPENNYKGDINIMLDGRLKTDSVKLAQSIEALEVLPRENTTVYLGKDDQKVDEVEIVEHSPSTFEKGDYAFIIDPAHKDFDFRSARLTSIGGNLKISPIEKEKDRLKFTVKEESMVASKLVLDNIYVDIGKYMSDGDYVLNLVNLKNPTRVLEKIKLFNVVEGETKDIKHFIKFTLDKNTYEVVKGDDVEVKGLTSPAFAKDGTTFLPLRAVGEALGMTVDYYADSQSARLTGENNAEIQVWLGKKEMKVNGEMKPLEMAPVIKNQSFFLPLRSIAEAINYNVEWNGEEQSIVLSKAKEVLHD